MTTSTNSIASPSDGYYPIIEKLPEGWENASVTYTVNGIRNTRIQIIDMRVEPPMQYRHEKMYIISIKCCVIILGLPFFLLSNLLFHCIRTIVLLSRTLTRSILPFIKDRTGEHLKKLVVDWTWEAPLDLAFGIRDFVKAPFFATEMGLCAFWGIFSPLAGRVLVADAERRWRGSDRKNDFKRFHGEPDQFFNELFTNRHSKKCHFMAYCFQPIGPINGNSINEVLYLKPKECG